MVQPVKDQSSPALSGQVSNLQRLWTEDGFALTIQLPPLLTADASAEVQQLAAQAHLFDAALTADAPDGAVALSGMAMAVMMKRAGIETVVRISGRDRNRLALQSDLLGLGALGIHNLLIDMCPVTRASLGQNADARLVTDLDGPALLAAAVRLRDEGRFISGASVKKAPVFYAGAALSLEEHIPIEALSSAQFVVTPPVLDIEHFISAFTAFQAAYPAFLRVRPLLVSLPLRTSSTRESANMGKNSIQHIRTAIKMLKGYKEVRGINVVVAGKDDLTSLEQVVSMVNEQLQRPYLVNKGGDNLCLSN